MKILLFLILLLPLSVAAQLPSQTGLVIGNNPGWYGQHYKDEDVHQLMLKAGNTSTRYFITLDVWRAYGFKTYVDRIKNAHAMGMRNNTFALTCQFYTQYPDQDTTTYPDASGKRTRTMMPKGLYEEIFLANGKVNPKNIFAVYCEDAIKNFGPYFDYWEIWNEPDITYNAGAADDPNFAHDPDSWWNRQPQPWEVYNSVAPVKDYVRLCEIGYKVIKKMKPGALVCTGGLGYPAYGYWFHKLGGGKWYDVLSIHQYPSYYLREWSNDAGKHVYNRHSDHAIQKSVDRVAQWQRILQQFSLIKPIICTEINIPRYSPDSIYNTSDALQRNYTLKLFPKFLQAGVDRTWLFVAGEVAEPGGSKNMFDYMGLYKNLKTATPGKEVMTEQGIACLTLQKLLHQAVYDKKLTSSLNLISRLDGAGFTLPSGKKAIMLWCKTTKDLSEQSDWMYRLPAELGTNYEVYKWDYGVTGVKDRLNGAVVALSATPVILVEK